MEKKFFIAGMKCPNCAKKVDDAVSVLAGVSSCIANADKASALINFDETVSDIESKIKSTVESLGFEFIC